jgi:hypothetical protein
MASCVIQGLFGLQSFGIGNEMASRLAISSSVKAKLKRSRSWCRERLLYQHLARRIGCHCTVAMNRIVL